MAYRDSGRNKTRARDGAVRNFAVAGAKPTRRGSISEPETWGKKTAVIMLLLSRLEQMTYSTAPLAAGRSGRGDAIKSSRARAPGVCALIWWPFYRGWNEPRAFKDGRHPREPARFVSQLPSDYVIVVRMSDFKKLSRLSPYSGTVVTI